MSEVSSVGGASLCADRAKIKLHAEYLAAFSLPYIFVPNLTEFIIDLEKLITKSV